MAFTIILREKTGYFDSKDFEEVVIDGRPERIYDRAHKAAFQAKINKFDKTSGISPSIEDCFKIVPGDGLSITRLPGTALLDGHFAFLDDPSDDLRSETLPEANQVYYYIIRSYVEYSPNEMQDRCMVEGALMNPDMSTIPMREENIFDLVLAKIEIPADTTQITDDMITDLRGDPVMCPFVEPMIMGNTGPQGKQGERGNMMMLGTSPPDPSLGVIGDSYIDTLTWYVYKKIDDLVWILQGRIKGDEGEPGKAAEDSVSFTELDDIDASDIPRAQSGINTVASGWSTVNFPIPFDGVPTVTAVSVHATSLTRIVTINNVTNTGFQVYVAGFSSGAFSATAADVSWIAIFKEDK